MLLRVFLLCLSSSLLLVDTTQLRGRRYAIEPRQGSPPPTSSPRETSTPILSVDTRAAKQQQNGNPTAASSTGLFPTSKAASKAAITSAIPTGDSSAIGSPSSASGDRALSSAKAVANDSSTLPSNIKSIESDELPIEPRITPAISVAGTILMVTGLFYTLVGIKTKWLHIFLSAAYLTSLAIAVLIVYVMHPPISNAIQGAFFVACFVTGAIFGGGSVVFADVTEGLGCLLGGYCLAMWFLVLTPGGLIKSNTGKAIFIACMSLAGFGCYVSRWTRAYGMIGAISFTGATVIVLGIDCFSRAGLKEFWVYIWDLNDDLLPLNYNGLFPITRGIRVEIAAIIILSLLGVMSQMKIWKIIKRRREQRAAENAREEQLQEQAEEELGRKVEEGNEHERTMWEAAYGRKSGNERHVDSGIGTEAPSVSKASLSIVATNEVISSRPDSIELDNLEQGPRHAEGALKSESKDKARAVVTVRVASDDEHFPSTSATDRGKSIDSSPEVHPPSVKDASMSGDSEDVPKTQPKPTRQISGPEVTPLPFKISYPDADGDGRSSIAASIASDHFSTRMLKRLSGGSLQRRGSKRSQRSYFATSTSEEALMMTRDDDEDRALSVEAAVDEVSDGHRSEVDGTTLAGLPTPDADEKSLLKFSPPTEAHPLERTGRKISRMSLGQTSSQSVQGPDEVPSEKEITAESPAETPEATADNIGPSTNQKPPSLATIPNDNVKEGPQDSEEVIPSASDQSPQKPALRESLAELDNSSKVVMAYRTNEWAKHLDRAEKPSFDDLRAVHTENVLSRSSMENPTPVDIPALQQTPLNAEPPPVLPKSDTISCPHINRSSTSNLPDFITTPQPHRSSSQSSLDSLPSQTQRTPQKTPRRLSSSQQIPHRTHRTSSTPLTHTPIEEDIPSTTFPQRSPYTPPLPTTNTLLSRRESMLQSRPSSTSLTRPLTRTPSSSTIQEEGDNIPLSHRRASLKQQQQQTYIPSSSSSNAYPFPSTTQQPSSTPTPNPPLNFRTSAAYTPRSSAHLDELLVQKRRSESHKKSEEIGKRERERERDVRWRRSGGGMEERHREAMRRMQAGVGGT